MCPDASEQASLCVCQHNAEKAVIAAEVQCELCYTQAAQNGATSQKIQAGSELVK